MDKQADLVPPWAEFPTYEHYTIGWRMGAGEDYIHKWYEFIESLPIDYELRLEYLKRHPPAPLTWANVALRVLYPENESEEEFGCSEIEIQELLDLGVVKYDAAYETWLTKQKHLVWPWTLADTPEKTLRYHTREFWFCSRQINTARRNSTLEFPKLPRKWSKIQTELFTGQLGKTQPKNGLLTMAQMLFASSVVPPWGLELTPKDFKDSFEMDMGYTDAYRLWVMSAFDDDKMLREMLVKIPKEWDAWTQENLKVC